MAETTAAGRPSTPAPAVGKEAARLFRELDNAGYWVEHLVLCADLVSGPVLDCPMPARALADGKALEFLLEEAKAATTRVRDATDALVKLLDVDTDYPEEG